MTIERLIYYFAKEAGELEVYDADPCQYIADFRSNHDGGTLVDAAAGSIHALARLRVDCGLPLIR